MLAVDAVQEFVKLPASPSAARQRSWALYALLDFATARLGTSVRALSVEEAVGCAEEFLHSSFVHGPPSLASVRARRAAVSSFAAWADVEVRLPTLSQVQLSTTPPPRVCRHFVSQVWGTADQSWSRARLAAQLGVLLHLPLRSAQMCQLRLTDFNGNRLTTQLGEVQLSRAVSQRMEHWLAVREAVLVQLQGTQSALWVSTWPNHLKTVSVPSGWALQPRGLQRSLASAAGRLQLTDPPPDPFRYPTKWEVLRRGLHPQAPR